MLINSQELPKYQNHLNLRSWIWRGWQINYTFQRVANNYQGVDIPIILLHGFGASIGHWRKNIPVLSEKHTVYALDLLGFGASQKVYTSYQVDLWASQIYDFWRSFINTPVILIGNSIGSLIALELAVNYPEMATGLVMLTLPDINQKQAMIPKFLRPVVTTIENVIANPWLIRIIFYYVRNPKIIRNALKFAYVDQSAVTDELVEIICQPTEDKGAARTLIALTKSSNKAKFSPSVKSLLKQLEIPTLLLWGDGDRLIPSMAIPKLVKKKANINLQLLKERGHCIHDESPNQFHQIFWQWREENSTNFYDR